MEYKINRLVPDYKIKPFESISSELNEYLFEDAFPALNELSAVTYLFEGESRTLAYCSLLNDKISREDVSNAKWKKIKKKFSTTYKSYPAVKIGRLAVDKSCSKLGLGTQILDWIRMSFLYNNKTGCRFVVVDAFAESLKFYEKCGFVYFSDHDKNEETRQMYFDLLSI